MVQRLNKSLSWNTKAPRPVKILHSLILEARERGITYTIGKKPVQPGRRRDGCAGCSRGGRRRSGTRTPNRARRAPSPGTLTLAARAALGGRPSSSSRAPRGWWVAREAPGSELPKGKPNAEAPGAGGRELASVSHKALNHQVSPMWLRHSRWPAQ